MGTFLAKLKRRIVRDRGNPLSVRLRDDTLAAARYVTNAASARVALQACDRVGAWARTAGKPFIENRGYIAIGSHVLLSSDFCPVQLRAEEAARIEIGDGSIINFGCVVAAQERVTIGRNVSLGPYCIVSDSHIEHPTFDRPEQGAGRDSAAIELGDSVWLAARVTVMPGVRIGAGSVVTAGSIVTHDLPAGVLAGGNPAHILRKLAPGEDVRAAEPSHEDAAAVVPAEVPLPALPLTAADAADSGRPLPSELQPLVAAPRETRHALLIADSVVDELAALLTDDRESPVIEAEVAPFDQVVPSLHALAASEDPPDLVVVWTRPESTVPAFARVLAFEPVDEASLLAEVDAFAKLLAESLEACPCVLIPTWTLPSHHRGSGLLDTRKGGATRALMAMNLRLMERLDALPHVHVLNAQRWLEAAGQLGQNPKLWYMGKLAFHPGVFAAAVPDLKAALATVLGSARKLIVVDLDDTLWGGAVGDVGRDNLRLGGHDAIGEAFVDFQRALKHLKRRGVLLGIVSKNTQSVALEAIRQHPEMLLRIEDFAGFRINWADKARNLAELCAELNIGLQSVVFIDDNPLERDRVRDALPEVLVPEWPEDTLLYASTLRGLRCFDAPGLSPEDAARSDMYAAEQLRRAQKEALGSVDAWLRSLAITVRAERLDDGNALRAAQLFNKTNQLNLATRRLTQSELTRWASSADRTLWVIHVSDRVGDSGLTGLVSLEVRGTTGHIVDFVLSCRVIGRQLEESLVHIAVATARSRGLTRVEARYVPTPKNAPCLDFWLRSGFRREGEHVFSWDASRAYPRPDVVELAFEVDASDGHDVLEAALPSTRSSDGPRVTPC
ncbi:MAG: HAD-IIIC family phosphatase [Polyangiales bacterium]